MESVKQYYDNYGIKEWKRLIKNPYTQLEFDTTLYFLRKYLPKRGLILDAGCGPGRYAVTLAKMNYNLVLFDLSPKQLKIARKKIKENKIEKKVKAIIEGSIVDLSNFKDNTFDAVLCTGGPLSHVIKYSKREKAVSELIRVAKKNAPIFISVIGRLGVLKHELTRNQQEIENYPHVVEKILKMGSYDGKIDFTQAHFFTIKELKKLLNNKVKILEIIGLEGLAALHEKAIIKLYKNHPKAWKTWWKIHLETCTIPSVAETSEHIMVICKKR
ncbi:MAG: hypothetical protein DRP84_10760 [Spirochaetes bacterium]|nr:MAG: hypothetical protein DRP84_10760 [Spirochaetota bacterium]